MGEARGALAELAQAAQDSWLSKMARIGASHGLFDRIGADHFGLYVDEDADTLLVCFDRVERARTAPDALPLGFEMVRQRSWSLLSVLSADETWFRDPALARFFLGLARGGLFTSHRRVIFAGLGPDCGFAACVFSRFAPGARVLAASPVATMAPAEAPFERRFRAARRLDFSGPLGHAPRALASAAQAVILYDPRETAEAAQAALFTGENTLRLALPHAGRDLVDVIASGAAGVPILRLLEQSAASPAALRAALREPLREAPGTITRKARAALVRGQSRRAAFIAREGLRATGDRRLALLLSEAEAARRPPAPARGD